MPKFGMRGGKNTFLLQLLLLVVQIIFVAFVCWLQTFVLELTPDEVFFWSFVSPAFFASFQANVKYTVPHFGEFLKWFLTDLAVNLALFFVLVQVWF